MRRSRIIGLQPNDAEDLWWFWTQADGEIAAVESTTAATCDRLRRIAAFESTPGGTTDKTRRAGATPDPERRVRDALVGTPDPLSHIPDPGENAVQRWRRIKEILERVSAVPGASAVRAPGVPPRPGYHLRTLELWYSGNPLHVEFQAPPQVGLIPVLRARRSRSAHGPHGPLDELDSPATAHLLLFPHEADEIEAAARVYEQAKRGWYAERGRRPPKRRRRRKVTLTVTDAARVAGVDKSRMSRAKLDRKRVGGRDLIEVEVPDSIEVGNDAQAFVDARLADPCRPHRWEPPDETPDPAARQYYVAIGEAACTRRELIEIAEPYGAAKDRLGNLLAGAPWQTAKRTDNTGRTYTVQVVPRTWVSSVFLPWLGDLFREKNSTNEVEDLGPDAGQNVASVGIDL